MVKCNWALSPFFICGVSLTNLEKKLSDLLESSVYDLGFEFVGLEFIRSGKHSVLRIYIDQENGINVDDCALVSRQVSSVLDVEDPISSEYTLEISSPGLERPLFKEQDYINYKGYEISLILNLPINNQRKFKGFIVDVISSDLHLKVNEIVEKIPLSNISRANLIPVFE